MSAQVKSFCLHRDGYSVVAFPKELSRAHLSEIREAGDQVVAELSSQKSPQCIVDLTNLDHVGSSMVASIVRIWKAIDANQGRMIVAASSNGVREVFRVTGLNKVWTIKTSYDHALHELGFSTEAKIVKRELRLLAFVGPATLLVGGIAVALYRVPKLATLSQPHELVAICLISMAVVTSGISVFRERSWRWWLSVIVFIVSAGLLGYLIWTSSTLGDYFKSKDKSETTTTSGSDSSSPSTGATSSAESTDSSGTAEVKDQGNQPARPTSPSASTGDGAPSDVPKATGEPSTSDAPKNPDAPADSNFSQGRTRGLPPSTPADSSKPNDAGTAVPGNSEPNNSGEATSGNSNSDSPRRPALEKP